MGAGLPLVARKAGTLQPAMHDSRSASLANPRRSIKSACRTGALIAAICLGHATSLPALATTAQESGRPRIGLALSGGGARGFSHVGVLSALEQLRVPVDCIVGTSAGSAVGAAYAVGLSPAEIEARLRRGDWDGRMFADQPSRSDLPYREQPRQGGVPGGFTLGVGEQGLKGSTGIFAGQQIELFLHRLLGVSTELPDFDALPVPFRAITTDLVSGEMVVQHRGSLVHAVRASMAVPSAFAPVRVGERMLVDGGLTQNLPVQVARQTCADVVIAVQIGSPLLKADELTGVFGVGLQVISILMERNVAESMAALRPTDVLIVPELGSISAVDFGRGVDGIPAGERATLAAGERLRRLAVPEADYEAWQQQRRARQPTPPLVNDVAVSPTRFVDPSFFGAVAESARGRAPGPVDVAALERRITRWNGGGHFTHIAYSVRPTREGHTLWIDANEKPWGPDYLQLGISGQTNSKGWSDFSVQAALRKTWLNAWGAEWLTVGRFGGTRELESSWFQPLGPTSPWFVEPRLSLSSRPLRLFVRDRAVGEFRIDRHETEVGLGWQGEPGIARLGLVAARIESEPLLGLLTVPARKTDIDGWRLLLAHDRLDDADFPRDGQALRIESFQTWGGTAATEGYRRSEVQADFARSAGAHGLHLRARWEQTSAGRGAVNDYVSTGGFLDLSGYQPGQFNGRELAYVSLGYSRRLLPLPQPFGSGLYAGLAVEAAHLRDPLGYEPAARLRRHGLAAYVGAATALGPAYVGLGLGEKGNRALYLVVGRP